MKKSKKRVIDVRHGIPYLNTKVDYLYIREHFTPEEYKPHFQNLLDDRTKWMNIGKLETKDQGIVNEKFKIVESEGQSGDMEYYQYEYKKDPNSKMAKLKFTIKEINSLMKI